MNKTVDWKLKGEKIAIEFLKSKKNSNRLLELEELLLSTDEECALATFPVIFDLFSKVFSTGILKISSAGGDLEDVYRLWLLNRYEDFISHLLTYLTHNNTEIQISALHTLLSFVKLESEFPKRDEKENQYFSFDLFKRIVSTLASDILNQHHLIKIFQEYTKYQDVKLFLLKSVSSLLEESHQVSELFLHNCFFLLYSMKFPKWTETETFAYRLDSQQPFQLKEKMFRKLFSSVWKCLLSYELSDEFLKKALHAFNENILPHLQNPCLMTDFLTNAFNKGGVLSLLALKGLYHLMDKYNLEYPDFFVKLYSLVDKTIINGKYNSRFFELTDLFLSSTHLPAHIVAAFAKKLIRLSLISRTDNVLKILSLISNLLVNHPSLGVLIHRTDMQELSGDPFHFHALDPSKSDAMKSSLWEIQTLQSHVNPTVSIKAKELAAAHPKLHLNVSATATIQDLYGKLRKRKLEDVPLAVHKPAVKQRRQCLS